MKRLVGSGAAKLSMGNRLAGLQLRGVAQAAQPNVELASKTSIPGLDEHGEPRFLENVKMFLNRAAAKTEIPEDVKEVIESCASVIRFNVPLVMDSGELRTIPCYRAQHSWHHLPVKGGTRYAPDIDLQVSSLASNMAADIDFTKLSSTIGSRSPCMFNDLQAGHCRCAFWRRQRRRQSRSSRALLG